MSNYTFKFGAAVATNPSVESCVRFGRFELDLSAGELRRSGVPLHLSPQPLKLLILLASRPGELVSREEIRAQLWGSGTFVDFEQGVNHCIRTIRALLEDGARSPLYIETVPRRGYRFIGPRDEPPLASSDRAPAPPELRVVPPPAAPGRPGRALGAVARWLRPWLDRLLERPRPGPALVRLAILPFDNLTGDTERECLSQGLTEEVRTQLSRASGDRLHLLSSCSAKALQGMPHPVREARQGGVDFLLGGSVRSAAGRARVNAHLVRVRDETQLWTESYERTLGDILDFQTEVALAIVAGARNKL
jgi:TolB-like protein/DNA-binding winged helix-turn-helix (wHTH) protein